MKEVFLTLMKGDKVVDFFEIAPNSSLLRQSWHECLNSRELIFVDNLHCSSSRFTLHFYRPVITFRQQEIRIIFLFVRYQSIDLLIETPCICKHCVLSDARDTCHQNSFSRNHSTNLCTKRAKFSWSVRYYIFGYVRRCHPRDSVFRVVFRMLRRRRRSSNHFTHLRQLTLFPRERRLQLISHYHKSISE